MADEDRPPPPADTTAADDQPSSARGSASVAAGILGSRITGLARERALTHYLGTGFAAEAFAVAARIPNLLQHLLGEGVLSASFIPTYSRLLGEGRDEDAGRLAGAVLGLLTVATGVLVLAGVLGARPLTAVLATGLRARPETFELTVRLVRLLFPATGLLVLSAWCLGVLNSHRRFFVSYIAPTVLNVVQVAVLVTASAVLAGGPVTGAALEARLVTWLAVGTIVGGAAQTLAQVPTTRHVLTNLVVSVRRDMPEVRETLRAFVPVVSARGVVQLSTFVQLFLASFLAAGSLAVLRYAQTLYALPISLFGMAVAAAELPEFGRSSRDTTVATARVRAARSRVALLVAPATIGYVVLGDVLVCGLYCSGRFGRAEALVVWLVLASYALGLLMTTSSRVLQSALYGLGDARTPARVAVLRVVVAVVVGGVLMLQFDRVGVVDGTPQLLGELPALLPLPAELRAGGPPRLGAVGLGLGSSVASVVELIALRRGCRRAGVVVTTAGGSERRALVVASAAALVASLVLRPFVTGLPALPAALLVVAVLGLVQFGTAAALGSTTVDELRRILPGRRR